MKKILVLLITTFLLTGCGATQVIDEPYTINGNKITFNKENLTFTFPTDFEVMNDHIVFGPKKDIPESPTGHTIFLSLEPLANLETLTNVLQEELAANISTLKLSNGLDYVTWNERAVCDFKQYEIIGTTNNIHLHDWSCEKKGSDSDKAIQDFLNSVQ